MDMNLLLMIGLASISAGGIALVFIYPYLSGEAKAEKRVAAMNAGFAAAAVANRPETKAGQARKRAVQATLDDIEQRTKKAKSNTLNSRIERAGLDWTPTKFYMFSAIMGVAAFVLATLQGQQLLVAAGLGVAGALGLPNWYLSRKRKKREKAFLLEFPNAIEVIVRGVKAGLPLNDCLRIIASEAKAPVGPEFQLIVEATRMGVNLPDAVMRLYDRLPMAEVNFFSVVIAIQSQTGGSLSEALGNLSKVLRERKLMKGKILAMSMEAKASAGIIGSLPFFIIMAVYFLSPDYIMLLFQTSTGNIMLVGSAIWMTLGVIVIKKMVNFDF